MTVRAIHVANITDAEREAWPLLAEYCGEAKLDFHRGADAPPETRYGVYATDPQEKALLLHWIMELRKTGGTETSP